MPFERSLPGGNLISSPPSKKSLSICLASHLDWSVTKIFSSPKNSMLEGVGGKGIPRKGQKVKIIV